MIIDVFTENDFNLNFKSNTLIYVYANWSANCQSMKVIIKQFEQKINIITIDFDNSNLFNKIRELNISSVPTFVLFKNYREVDRKNQTLSYKDLKKMII